MAAPRDLSQPLGLEDRHAKRVSDREYAMRRVEYHFAREYAQKHEGEAPPIPTTSPDYGYKPWWLIVNNLRKTLVDKVSKGMSRMGFFNPMTAAKGITAEFLLMAARRAVDTGDIVEIGRTGKTLFVYVAPLVNKHTQVQFKNRPSFALYIACVHKKKHSKYPPKVRIRSFYVKDMVEDIRRNSTRRIYKLDAHEEIVNGGQDNFSFYQDII